MLKKYPKEHEFPVLSVHDLSIEVAGKPLVENLTFDVHKGEIFALVGESGSGKSLTSLAIMRLLPPALQVSSGSITMQEQGLFALTEAEMQQWRGKKIAMIFQEPMTSLNPVMKVGEQVAEVIRVHLRLGAKAARSKVIALFEEVGIPEASARYHWYPHQLSGGQKQRVMIAMALACEPDLLIADEPTTALDVTIQAQVLQLLKNLRQTRKLSILFITHDMGVVHEMADTIAVLRQGKLVELAHKARFFKSPQHPYTQKLLADSVPKSLVDAMDERQPLLELSGLQVYFPIRKGLFQRTVGHLKAVDGVDLSILRGQTLALVGESGSGKSTIGQAILNLTKTRGGEVRFFADKTSSEPIVLNRLSERKMRPLRKKIQVIFQDPFSALNPRMTIREILREGMQSLQVGPRDREQQNQRLEALLLQVGLLPEHLDRYPHEFSGGQRQRIGIARALAVEPELIICDEPTSALDVSVRAQVLQLLHQLQQQYGISYLFITHDLSIVPTIAHRVAVMQQGKIVEQGEVRQVLQSPQHDYTRALLASAPELVRQALAAPESF